MTKLDDAVTVAARIADRFEDGAIPYAIGGALALAAYGMQRMTNDAYLGVFIEPDRLPEVHDALERGGCLFERDRAAAEVERASFFTVRCGVVLADIFVSFHPHHDDARERRRKIRMGDGVERWFLSPEDLAIHKLAMLRPKDLMDLEHLFAAQSAGLDVEYIRRWVEAIAPEALDRRRAAVDDLVGRFTRAG